jgi:MFS transporter, DHA1 family, inner membrane transport protein
VSDPDLNSPKAIIGAIGVMVMVPMFFLVMPMYVGALFEDYGFTNAQIGYLISIELGCAALASLTALFWLRQVNWRTVLLVFLFLLGAMNALSILTGGVYEKLLLIRAVAGFSAGAMMAVALAALGDTENQDRNFALGVMGQLGISGCLLLVLPYFITRWGAASIFTVFLIACAIAAPLIRWLPSTGKAPVAKRITERRSLMPLWGLAGSAAIFVGQAAVWAFIERMGSAAGLSPSTIGLALGSSVLAGIAGALAASWLADRKGRRIPMAIAMIGEVVCLLFLFGGYTTAIYFSVVIFYSVCWNFWLPYQMGVIAETDVSGRFVALITLSQAVGIAVGPALVGPMINQDNFDPVVWTGIGFALLAMVMFLPVTASSKSVLADAS